MNLPAPFNGNPRKLTAAALAFFLFAAATCVRAQDAAAARQPSEAEVAQRGLARARALAAIGKLAAAAAELESLRASTREDSVRDVSRVLLVSIYIEMPDYGRAAALLDETFRARQAGQASGAASGAYFAVAGQTINSVRQHLDRYRTFGLNVADADLPAEAHGDLEQLRGLLERVVEQAKAVWGERGAGADAMALLEDAATVRMRVARHGQDRARWQAEVSDARQHLFASETRLASLGSVPGAPPAHNQTAPAAPVGGPQQSSRPAREAPSGTSDGARTADAQQPLQNTAAEASAPAADADRGQAAPGLVSIGLLNGLARQRATPSYPSIAKSARVEGVVTVYLIVNEKGEVESVERSEGPQQLRQAASDAARRWKFNPTVVNGRPVRVSGYINFNFTL